MSAAMDYCIKEMKYLQGDLIEEKQSFPLVEYLALSLENAGRNLYIDMDEDGVKPATEYVEKAIEMLESCYELLEDMSRTEGNFLKVWKYQKRRKKR